MECLQLERVSERRIREERYCKKNITHSIVDETKGWSHFLDEVHHSIVNKPQQP